MGERVTGAREEAFWQLSSRTRWLQGHGGGGIVLSAAELFNEAAQKQLAHRSLCT